MFSPQISVIVPVYNSKDCLRKCLDSILQQSFPDYEILLIDDGSTDDSGNICNEYAAKDARVQVFHQSNKGVGAARNHGLGQATGEWVVFIHSDDWVEPFFFENLLNHASGNVDLVVSCLYWGDDENRSGKQCVINSSDFHLLFSEIQIDANSTPWGKLFKRHIISENHIRFPEGINCGEDAAFLYEYLNYVGNVYVMPGMEYHYKFHDSLSGRINSVEMECRGYNVVSSKIDEMILKREITHEVAIKRLSWHKSRFAWRALNALYNGKKTKAERLTIIKELVVNLQDHSDTKRERFLKWLLLNRYYQCYDFIRYTLTKMRKYHFRKI